MPKALPIAAAFTIALIGVIVLADTGRLGPLGFIYSFQHGDKVGHFGLLAVLALLVELALFQLFPRRNPQQLALLAAVTLSTLISLEEFSQLWMPRRSPDAFDLAASLLGIAAGSFVALVWQSRARVSTLTRDRAG